MSAILNAAVGAASEPIDGAFRITIVTPTPNYLFTLRIGGVTSINVDWGDGTVDTGITSDNPSHTYATAGTHSISVTGTANTILYNNIYNPDLTLKTVTNLGSLGWTTLNASFGGAAGLQSFNAGDCDTSNVTDMRQLFDQSGAALIWGYPAVLTYVNMSGMDTSSVTNMRDMFLFNFNLTEIIGLSEFDTSNVSDITQMIYACYSLQNLDIDGWDVTSLANANNFLSASNLALTRAEYDKTLVNWAAQSVQSNVRIHFGAAKYSANSEAAAARQTLVDTYGWIITDGGVEDSPFQMTIQTTTANEVFELAANSLGLTYNATVDWGDGTNSTITSTVDPDRIHTYATAGTYQISISGVFPAIRLSLSSNDSENKLISVDNLGTVGHVQPNFLLCSNMTSFTPGTCSTTQITSMAGMFQSCSSLTSLDLTAFDTSNVTNMVSMFQGCNSLTTLDYSNWDTSKVTNMGKMHRDCISLQTVSFADWDVSSVQDFNEFFYNCEALTLADVSNWDTSSITTFFRMFYDCINLTTIDVSGFETRNCTGNAFGTMFAGCNSVTTLDVSRFNTSNCTDLSAMFSRCNSVTYLDVSNWDTSNATSMRTMFQGCNSLTTLDVSNWDTSNVTDMFSMFESCYVLDVIDVSNWDTSNVTNMGDMFEASRAVTELDFSNWNTAKVTDMTRMFQDTRSVTELNFSSFDTSSLISMTGMINQITPSVKGLENFSVENVTSILTSFGITRTEYDNLLLNWEAQNVQNNQSFTARTRYSANSLAAEAKQRLIDDHGWVISDFGEETAAFEFTVETTTASETFTIPCVNIGTFDATVDWGDSTTSTITAYNDADLTHTYATAGSYQISVTGKFPNVRFANDTTSAAKVISVDNLGVVGWQSFVNGFSQCVNMTSFTPGITSTLDVTSLYAMFLGCSSLTTLDLTAFDTSNVIELMYICGNCTNLVSIDVSSFDLSKVFRLQQCFINCSSLVSLDLSNWSLNPSVLTNMTEFARSCTSLQTVLVPKNWVLPPGMLRAFHNCSSLTSFTDVSEWDTSNVTDFNGTFLSCSSLIELNVTNWDVSSCTTFSSMFNGCGSLQTLPVGNWDVSSGILFNTMFAGVGLNGPIDVVNWNTSSATNMASMFEGAGPSVDLSNWDVSNVTSFSRMFRSSQNNDMSSIGDLSNWNTSSATTMYEMFYGTSDIVSFKGTENFNIENVTDLTRYRNSSSGNYGGRDLLDKLLINWSQQNVQQNITINFGFQESQNANGAGAAARQSLVDNDGWIISLAVTDSPFRFTIQTTTTNESFTIPCQNIGTFDATIDWGDGSATQTITAYNDANLTHTFATAGTYQIEISGKFPNVYFYGDATSRAKVVSVDNLGTVGWQSFFRAFRDCVNMTSFTPGTTSTLDVTNMQDMFAYCSSLTSLDLTAFDTSNVDNMSGMFQDCTNLVSVDVSGFDTSNVTNMASMFFRCFSLTSIDVTNFDTSNVTNTSYMFGVCDSLVGEGVLDVSGFDTSNVTNMAQMFRRTQVPDLDLRNFETSKVTSFFVAFERYNYPDEDVQGIETFDMSSVTDFNTGGTFSTERYDAMLINYSGQNLQTGVTFSVGSSKYTPGGDAEAARTILVNTYGWVITDGGPVT